MAYAVRLDPFGNIYIADTWNHRIQRWAPDATTGETVAGGNGQGNNPDQFYNPMDLAFDRDGSLVIDDQSNNRIQRWAPGATAGVTIAGGNGEGPAANQLAVPQGVALDSAGNVYVSDWRNARVQRWAPGATAGETVAGGHGWGPSANKVSAPAQLVVDRTGNLYVAEGENNRVSRWAPDPPSVIPTSASVVEGDSGMVNVNIPVTLSHPSDKTVTVGWTTVFVPGAAAGQADPATDYTPASGTVTFTPGEISHTVTVTVAGDTLVEPDEYFVVSFHDPVNAVMGGFYGLGIGRIIDDDRATVVPGAASATEGQSGSTTVEVPVALSKPSTVAVTVPWTTLAVSGAPAGQADPGSDYTATSGTVTFAPGETAQTVSIQVSGDTTVEPDEYIVVSFHDPTNAIMGGFWGLGFGGITNDD